MASNKHVAAAICSLLLLLLQTSATTEERHAPTTTPKHSFVVVEGLVYCQKCRNTGSLTGAKTIPCARVGVTCKDSRHQVSFYKVYTANERGYFFAKLDGFKMGHGILDHPLQACTVKLVSSPLNTCNVPTNLNSGVDGAELRFENKVVKTHPYETVIFAAGPLAFRPSKCPTQFADYVHA